MPFDYAKDNMERRPYEFYIEEYRQADPIEISNRLGVAYDVQKFDFYHIFYGCELPYFLSGFSGKS